MIWALMISCNGNFELIPIRGAQTFDGAPLTSSRPNFCKFFFFLNFRTIWRSVLARCVSNLGSQYTERSGAHLFFICSASVCNCLPLPDWSLSVSYLYFDTFVHLIVDDSLMTDIIAVNFFWTPSLSSNVSSISTSRQLFVRITKIDVAEWILS